MSETKSIESETPAAVAGAAICSESRSYWLYVWNESTQIPGRPANWSERPMQYKANSPEEAHEWAKSRVFGKIGWELYDGCGWNENPKLIASKNRGLVTPNAEVSEVAVADATKTRGVRPPLSLD